MQPRYHGTSPYGFVSVAATAYVFPSEPELGEKGHETLSANSRGVHTSKFLWKATNYAVPILLPGSPLFSKVVLLVAVPGEESRGGVGVWEKATKHEWVPKPESPRESDKIPAGWYLKRHGQETLPSGHEKRSLVDTRVTSHVRA